MSIYIARGDETLGPYTPEEANRLMEHGWLLPVDLAARDSDQTWTPLATILTPGAATLARNDITVRSRSPIYKPATHRIAALLTGMSIAGILLVVAWLFYTHPQHPMDVAPQVAYVPAIASVAIEKIPQPSPDPPLRMPSTEATSPSPARPSRLTGAISLTKPGGVPRKFAGVRVMAYPLDEVTPVLAQKKAQVQAQVSVFLPQIEAAKQEQTVRESAEKATLQAYLDTTPANPLYASLHFAHE